MLAVNFIDFIDKENLNKYCTTTVAQGRSSPGDSPTASASEPDAPSIYRAARARHARLGINWLYPDS